MSTILLHAVPLGFSTASPISCPCHKPLRDRSPDIDKGPGADNGVAAALQALAPGIQDYAFDRRSSMKRITDQIKAGREIRIPRLDALEPEKQLFLERTETGRTAKVALQKETK